MGGLESAGTTVAWHIRCVGSVVIAESRGRAIEEKSE
jgi:hypothetical protein